MRLRLLLYVSLLLVACDPDTSESPDPEDVFVKLYGNAGTESAADLLVKRDQEADQPTGYVIFGTTNSPALRRGIGNDSDYYLISTDLAGNETPSLEGSDTFSESYDIELEDMPDLAVNLQASKVIQTTDGGFLMVGTALDYPVDDPNDPDPTIMVPVSRAYLVKVSATGMPEWNILYPGVNTPNLTAKSNGTEESLEVVNDVIQTNDGNILIIGSTTNINTQKPDLIDPSLDDRDIWIVKFDPTGLTTASSDLPAANIVFERVLGFPGIDIGVGVFERADGRLVIVGNGQGESATQEDLDIYFISSDQNAFNNNFQELGTVGEDDFINEAQLLSDGGVAIVGYTATAAGDRSIIARVEPSGNLSFPLQTIDFALTNETNGEGGGEAIATSITDVTFGQAHRAFGVTQTLSGDLAIVGEVEDVTVNDPSVAVQPSRENDIYLVVADGFGQIDATSVLRNFGGIGDDRGEAITQIIDPDDGVSRFLVLSTVDFEGGSTVISLMKTSSSGRLLR